MADNLIPYNLYRQLLVLSRHVETVLMTKLSDKGHQGLKMSYTEPMLQISMQPIRLNDLAAKLGISKQFCNQSLKPIESLGLISRENDPEDGRARLISLTEKGKALNEDSFLFITELTDFFNHAIGEKALSKSTELTNKLVNGLNIIDSSNFNLPLASLLSALSRYCEKHLMELTREQGFNDLQMSYTQVLGFLAMESKPVTVSFLAEQNNVSSQAISKTVHELEDRGYIIKTAASNDKRSKHITLSKKGNSLIKASIQSSNQIDQELIAIIGKKHLLALTENLFQITKHINKQSKTITEDNAEAFIHYIEAYFYQGDTKECRRKISSALTAKGIEQLHNVLDAYINHSKNQ